MNEKCRKGEVVSDRGQSADQNTEVKRAAQAQGHRKLCFNGRELLLNCRIYGEELIPQERTNTH